MTSAVIEFLPETPPVVRLATPSDVAAEFAAFARRITASSRIVWGEHCSECAYPACYSACAFYAPRSDLNCRRFEAGIEPVEVEGAPGRLHRIRFRKWGKLEGRGAARLQGAAAAERSGDLVRGAASALSALPAPFALSRWLACRGTQHARTADSGRPLAEDDVFAIEAWAADGRTHPFTLTILNPESTEGRLYQTQFEVGPAYGRVLAPAAEIARHVDLDRLFLVQIEPVGEAAGREVVFGTLDFVALKPEAKPATAAAPLAKVLVWDLDETLWTGTLAEDGPAGVVPRPEAVEAIEALDRRGVLHSIASKNNHAEAMQALSAFGLADYFLHPQIHWNPKSGSVAAIARALDLGLDSFVFVDDQPFERAEVSSAHPAVRTLAHTDVAGLATHPWFDMSATPESARRRSMYRAEAQRVSAQAEAGADYLDFLRASRLVLDMRPLAPSDAERVYELSQRTNQLNFRGTKYDRAEVRTILEGGQGLAMRCADRFGDYGLIAFAVADIDTGMVRDFFMSCRVQRKRVEHALFAELLRRMAGRGVRICEVAYKPSTRNGASVAMLTDLGFTPPARDADVWTRPTAEAVPDADVVQLVVGPKARAA